MEKFVSKLSTGNKFQREGGRGEAAQAVFLTFTKLQLYYSFSFFCLTSYLSSPGETELGPPRCKFYLVSF